MTVTRVATAALTLLLAAACTTPAPPRAQVSTGTTPACSPPQAAPGKETATTIDVIEQAFFCILGNYYGGATLHARALLTAGFAALTQELDRAGRDLPGATMPALTGDRTADWAAFEATYRKITAQVPDLRDTLAVTTLEAIVAALGDDHARWTHGVQRPPDYYDGDGYGLGFETNIHPAQVHANPGAASPPLFVTTVEGGAARAAGLHPGDIIESINDSAPFIDGTAVTPALAALDPRYPEARPVRLRLKRPATGRRRTVTLEPGLYQRNLADLRIVTSKLLDDDVAYVRVQGFAPDAADRALKAIARLRTGRTLTGVVLDLRGNGGGSAGEAIRLVSAFVHDKITAYQCTADGTCRPMRTDDTVDLLGLPLMVLTDRGCASACEHFAAAVKDLHAGQLVGTRTAGVVSGPAGPFLLSDNTILSLPAEHHLGPDHEVLDRIGVAPGHYVRPTPEDVAAGRDPALAKALTLLHK